MILVKAFIYENMFWKMVKRATWWVLLGLLHNSSDLNRLLDMLLVESPGRCFALWAPVNNDIDN